MGSGDIICLDLGLKRTGLARASQVARIAEPLKIVETKMLIDEILNYQNHTETSAVVVGLPRNSNGDDTDQTLWVKDWVNNAKAHLKLPFYYQDEYLSTKLAEDKSGDAKHHDDQAAAIILQDFLNASHDNRTEA